MACNRSWCRSYKKSSANCRCDIYYLDLENENKNSKHHESPSNPSNIEEQTYFLKNWIGEFWFEKFISWAFFYFLHEKHCTWEIFTADFSVLFVINKSKTKDKTENIWIILTRNPLIIRQIWTIQCAISSQQTNFIWIFRFGSNEMAAMWIVEYSVFIAEKRGTKNCFTSS